MREILEKLAGCGSSYEYYQVKEWKYKDNICIVTLTSYIEKPEEIEVTVNIHEIMEEMVDKITYLTTCVETLENEQRNR